MIQQNSAELDWFLGILREEGVKSYLEVGSNTGETLVHVSKSLPPRSTVVSVDDGRHNLEALRRSIIKIGSRGHRAQLLVGDSTNPGVVKRARKLGPFDACLIDANHTLPYVINDFKNYSPFCRIIAFHDIGWKPKEGGPLIEVPEFWHYMKGAYKSMEINLDKRSNGIGVLWM